jgi:outer membrane protein OmpA-like peptidoglycan-associated protein
MLKPSLLKIAAITFSALAIGTSLVGCAREPFEFSCESRVGKPSLKVNREIAVVLAPTSNFIDIKTVLTESDAQISKLLELDGTQLTIVIADSTPSVVSKQWVDFSEAVFEPDRIEIVDKAKDNLTWASTCASGDAGSSFQLDSEVDLLGAIQVASDSFTAGSDDKYLFVLANGIQTSGQLVMQEGLPSDVASGDKIGKQLLESGALGDLRGAKVYWSGLAQLNELEPQPNQLSKDVLVSIWAGIIRESGGKIASLAPGTTPATMPSATAVKVTSISWLPDACVSVTLGAEKGFEFNPDLATFVNIEKAREGALEVAEQVNASSCSGTVTLTGYTASGRSEADYLSNYASVSEKLQVLSLARANAFADLLREAGMNGNIEVIGAGKGPVVDWDDKGNFVEELGAQNRKVVVTQN